MEVPIRKYRYHRYTTSWRCRIKASTTESPPQCWAREWFTIMALLPSMLTFKRTPSRFATTKVYSISVFLFPWKAKLPVKPILGPFWKFLHKQKNGFTSTFSVFFTFTHTFFHGQVFHFFHMLEIFCYRGKYWKLTINRLFGIQNCIYLKNRQILFFNGTF